jgi:HlyD family secretion protein
MRVGFARLSMILVAAVAAMALVWSLMPGPVAVEVATVIKGRFVATTDEDGKTRIRERYVVAAPILGKLARIRLKVGDRVSADDAIATILPPPAALLDPRSRQEAEEKLGAAEAERDRTRALIERATAQADQARTDLQRTRTLVERGASNAQALERAALASSTADRDLIAARFQDHAAEHDLNQARAILARYHDGAEASMDRWLVTAPVAGVVLKVAQESEAIVQPGAPLVEIGDPLDLEIAVDVLSSDAVEIRPGAEVAIDRWGGEGPLAGRVRRVEPEAFTKISALGVEEQRVNVLVDVTSPAEKWDGLGDGFQVSARITLFAQDDATIAPTGALFSIGDAWNAYVVKAGRAERRAVVVSRRSDRFAAVSDGLAPGESVVLYPSDRVAPGVRVDAR